MNEVGSALLFVLVTGILLVAGVWIGMLIAPRLGRLMDSDDEGSGDDD